LGVTRRKQDRQKKKTKTRYGAAFDERQFKAKPIKGVVARAGDQIGPNPS